MQLTAGNIIKLLTLTVQPTITLQHGLHRIPLKAPQGASLHARLVHTVPKELHSQVVWVIKPAANEGPGSTPVMGYTTGKTS
jgi:hypothetical protein